MMKLSVTQLTNLIQEQIRRVLIENKLAYYGSTQPITKFDLRKTKEFGIHLGLENPNSSLHRIETSGGYLYHVLVTHTKPLHLPDVLRWTLEAVLRELRWSSDQIREQKLQASKNAKYHGTSLREEENVLLGNILDNLGYDSVVYENKGEAGGDAVIVWHPEQIQVIKQEKVLP